MNIFPQRMNVVRTYLLASGIAVSAISSIHLSTGSNQSHRGSMTAIKLPETNQYATRLMTRNKVKHWQ